MQPWSGSRLNAAQVMRKRCGCCYCSPAVCVCVCALHHKYKCCCILGTFLSSPKAAAAATMIVPRAVCSKHSASSLPLELGSANKISHAWRKTLSQATATMCHLRLYPFGRERFQSLRQTDRIWRHVGPAGASSGSKTPTTTTTTTTMGYTSTGFIFTMTEVWLTRSQWMFSIWHFSRHNFHCRIALSFVIRFLIGRENGPLVTPRSDVAKCLTDKIYG